MMCLLGEKEELGVFFLGGMGRENHTLSVEEGALQEGGEISPEVEAEEWEYVDREQGK